MTTRCPAVILAASLIVAAGLLLPLAFVSVPPFCDLYFHIARMVVLADPSAPYVRDWYAPDWHVLPNLAMDAIVPLLARIMPVLTAVKLFVAATFLLLLFGTLALHHALYRQLSWLPLLAGLFVYNQIVFIGYFNYLFGLALALWAARSGSISRRALPSFASLPRRSRRSCSTPPISSPSDFSASFC